MVPQMACFNLLPVHNSSSQPDIAPYKITLGNKYYHPNDHVKGKLTLNRRKKFLSTLILFLSNLLLILSDPEQ